MTFLIGGFSENQYNSYLMSPLDEPQWEEVHWISYYAQTSYSFLTILINRVAHLIFHGFKEYLNNIHLFEKFKSHDFSSIDSKEHYNIAKSLFKRFQACPEIDSTSLKTIKTALKQVKHDLKNEQIDLEKAESEAPHPFPQPTPELPNADIPTPQSKEPHPQQIIENTPPPLPASPLQENEALTPAPEGDLPAVENPPPPQPIIEVIQPVLIPPTPEEKLADQPPTLPPKDNLLVVENPLPLPPPINNNLPAPPSEKVIDQPPKEPLPLKIPELDDLNPDHVLGKEANSQPKTWGGTLFDYSIGWATKQSDDPKDIQWKVERFEALFSEIKRSILHYIYNEEFKPFKPADKPTQETKLEQLLSFGTEKNVGWINALRPILETCRMRPRSDPERFNQNYLQCMRQTYNENLLANMRKAAEWSKTHPHMPGVEHIDAICGGLLYMNTDLNAQCLDIFKTFITLGQEHFKGMPHQEHSLPLDAKYDLIRRVNEVYHTIEAVPSDAKTPLVHRVANSARGHLNGVLGVTSFDPNMQSNPVHVVHETIIQSTEGNQKKTRRIKDIAMGSPTIEAGTGIAEINNEFLAYLRHCKRNQLVHLYINNQNFIQKSWLKGDESARCQALHDVADQEFKDTFFVITLSQNSPFYLMTGHNISSLNAEQVKKDLVSQLLASESTGMGYYIPADLKANPIFQTWLRTAADALHEEKDFDKAQVFKDEAARELFIQKYHAILRQNLLNRPEVSSLPYTIYDLSADSFKKELIAQLFDRDRHETGNCIPPHLVEEHDLRSWTAEAANQIHLLVFGNRQELSVKERRIFIRLVYMYLARKMMLVTEADNYNASCKDRIDRGAATEAENYANLAILNNCANDPKVIEFFEPFVFVRALIVRKRNILKERLERMFETVKYMLESKDEIKLLQQTLFPNVSMTIDHFPKQ